MSTALHAAPAHHRRPHRPRPPGGRAAAGALPGVVVSGRGTDAQWILLTAAGVQLSLLLYPPAGTGLDGDPWWLVGTGDRLDFLARRLRAHRVPVSDVPSSAGSGPGLLLHTPAGDLLITELPPITKDPAKTT